MTTMDRIEHAKVGDHYVIIDWCMYTAPGYWGVDESNDPWFGKAFKDKEQAEMVIADMQDKGYLPELIHPSSQELWDNIQTLLAANEDAVIEYERLG